MKYGYSSGKQGEGVKPMKLQSSKDDTAGFSNPTTLQSPYFPAVKDDEAIS